MFKFSLLNFIFMLLVSFGCNNPKGSSVIGSNHTPLLQPPAAFAFTQIRAVDGSVQLLWQTSPRAETYQFFTGTDPAAITTPITSCSNDRESCQLTGLDANTLYYYSVTATNSAGSRVITSSGRSRAVGSFDISSSTAGDGSIVYNWGASSNATSYNLIYGTVPGLYPQTVTNITSPYTLTGLTNGTMYYARIVAVNTDNGYALNTTEASERPFGPLVAPTGVVATATPGVITLDWNDLGGATSYEIWDSTGSTLIGTSVTSSFAHNHGSNGTTYTYKVRGLNGFNGAFSAVVTARSIAAFAIGSVVAGPLPGQVTVTWPTPVTGAASYNIRFGSNPVSLSSQVTNVTSPYVFSGLTGGLTYYFTVVATNPVGLGTAQNSSNQLSATPVAAIAAPTGLTAVAAPTSVTLNWNIVPGASQYNIYRGTSTGSYAFVNSSATNSFIDTGATPGSTYFYVVRSFNGLESGNSLEVSKQPIANFSFSSSTVATFASADLVWAAATGATGYDILYGTTSGSYTSTSLNRTTPTTLTGLTPATTYYVAIRAKNSAGGGTTLLSNERTFTTSAQFPTVTITGFGLINVANRAAYTLSGTCTEDTRAVTLNVGGVPGSTVCSSNAWSVTMNVTAAPESAALSIVATHTNSGGNSDTDSKTVIKDATNPTVAITSSPAIRVANEAAYVVSGTCSENTRTVDVSVGGINASPVCTSLAWSATINTSGLADAGSVTITANLTDAAGNTATQASVSVVKDTVAPSVAINSSPVINNANKATYTFSGTCSETGENVAVKVGAITGTVPCTLLTWTATLNVTSVADSPGVLVTADHSDDAGNPATQASTLVLKDTVNPSVTIASSPTIINANKNAYPISGTCSENTRTVTVSVGGVTATPNCSASTWSASLDVSGLADAPSIAVSAIHTDTAGNSLTASTTVVKNTALPTVAITSSTAINNTNKNAYVVSGTCSEAGRTVAVVVGGLATGNPVCSSSAWTTTINVSGVTDSANVTITADHSDSVGNNANQASTTVVKDIVIPTVSITSSPAINNANKDAYTISGACSENTRNVSVNVGGVTATPVCSALAWTTTLVVSGIADNASVAATASHTDAVGNAATVASTTVVKDTVIPTVAITVYPAINSVNDAAYTVSGTCSENTRQVSVNVGGVTATPTCSSSAWSTTLDVSGVSDGGAISITANHSDAVGNPATQASRTVVKDTALPTVAITSTPVINNANKNAYTFSGTCSETGQNVSVAVGITTSSVMCTLLTWSATLNVSGNADSLSLLITANHSDAVGNAAVQAATSSVKDTVIPTVAITSSPAITNTNKAAYVVSGTCSENTRDVSVNVGGVTATPACSTLTWSATLDVTGVTDGASVSITANHSDSAGNAATTASTTVVKDTIIPTVAITSSPVINNTNKAAYTVSGTCSVNSRLVTVNVGGIQVTPTCTALAWSTTLSVTGLVDNSSISITADHDDAVGNDANQATASVLKDTVVPTVAITSSPVINNANKAAYTVAGTCSENGRTVNVSVGGVPGTPTCSAGTWSSTLGVTGVSDSVSVSVSATHSDLAGNAATPASTTVVKDTSNPTVAITSSPVINNTNKAAYTVSGTCSENTRTVSVSVGGVTGSPTCTASAWSTTLDVTLVADNANVAITADHSDVSGNNATQATASVLKDTAIPTVAITSSPVINNTNKAAYVLSGTCSENSRQVSVSVGGLVTGTPTCSSNTWSTTLVVTTVADSASVAITANHIDAANNAATQASTTVLKDTVIPTVAITSYPSINAGNASAYPVSGTCSENGVTVTIAVGGVPGTPTCTAGAWSSTLNVSGVADSPTVAITANHVDVAGNAATQASRSVAKVTGLPTVAITSSPAINNTNKNAYPVSGTCSENTRTVSLSVGGVTATPVCTTNAWSASLNVSGLGDGASIAITADHDDSVGNDANQATTTVLKDTVIPTVAITSSPAINNTNKATYPVSGTCSENTQTVSVVIGAFSGTPVCTAGAWSTVINVTGVTDNASVTITATHSDAASNAATPATTNVVKDTVIPTVTISLAPSINNTNKAAYPVSGACSENTRQVSVSVGGVSATPTCAASAWSTSVDVSGISDSATVTVTANHADASGNNATQASTTVVKDTAIPTVAITSSPAINNTNRLAYTVSGTCSENGRAVSVNVGGVTGSPNCTSLAWTATLNVDGVADNASVSITANHSDAAGNAATQASASVVKDVVVPTVAITAPVAINIANEASYPISGTCSENTRTVTVVVGGVSGTPTCSAGAWSTSLDVSGVGDGGSIAITANHTDAVGNNAVQASTTTSKDTSNPTVAITSSTAINNTNKAAYPVSGTCSENTRTVSVVVGGVSASPTCTALAWSTAVDVTGVSDGPSIAITANHIDAAGNAATQASTTVLKDTAIPTVAITSSPAINNANRLAYVVSGTCSENTRSVSVNVGSASGSGTCTALAWSATINANLVSDSASVSVTAQHTDLAGNAATIASTTVVKDTSNPTVAISSSPVINQSNSAAYTVSGTCSENTIAVTVSVGGVGSSPVCTTGAWSATVNASGLADSGSVSITANHTDAAGNTATQASTTVVKDTAIPTVAITSTTAINNANRLAYVVSGTCSENGRAVGVDVGGRTATPTCTALAWSATLNMNLVSDSGAVAASATHVDAAGNAATPASTTFLKDTVIPTVAITSSPLINNANKAAYTVSGTCSENTRTVSFTIGLLSGTPTCTASAWSITLDVTTVPDGASVSVTANHTDLAGNAATQASTTVVKDTSNPTVAITSSPVINNTNKAAYTVSGTCSENTRQVAVLVGGSVPATPTCSAGAWSSTLDVTGVSDSGTVAITANHTDASGNNATQASTTVLKDTVIPTVAITSAPAINNTNKAAYPISGTCSENTRQVSVLIGGSVSATPTCTAGAWSASMIVTALADNASVSVTANHTDAALNAATTASTTVVKDTGLPTIAINSPAIINNANKAAYTVNGTCSETGRTVSVMVGNVSASDTCTLLNWTVTVDASFIIDSGSVLITADHVDAAGNNAVQAATSTVKDTVNPTVALNAVVAITNANRNAYTVTGTCSENTRTVTVSIGGVPATPSCSGGTWTTGAINVTGAPDSLTLAITANHSDSAGNTATTASTTVVKDTTNPTVAITSSPTINIANRLAYTVSGTCSENTRDVSVMIGTVSATPTCSGGTWTTGAISVTGATDSATLSITANHTDAVGNAATQATASVLKDTVAPTVAFASAAGNPVYAAFVVRALFSESVTGVAAGDFTTSNATTSGFTIVSATTYDINVNPSSEGGVTVDMPASAASDTAGNPSTAAIQFSRAYQLPAMLSFANTSTHDFGTVASGGFADVTMLINKSGTPNATAVTEISLAAPFAFKGGSFPGTGGTCTTTIAGTCSIVVTFSPTAAGSFNDFVQLQYNNASTTVSVSRAITGTGVVLTPTLVEVEGPGGILINQCIPFTIYSRTASGQTANVSANQTVNLVVNNGAGGFFSNATCATAATSTIINNGTSSRIIYFRATTANQNLTLVFNPATLTSTSKPVNTSANPTRISVNPPAELEIDVCNPIIIDLVDANGNKAGRAVDVQVNLTENGNAVYYSDSLCTGSITSTTLPALTETKTVYVKNPTVQAITLTFTDNAAVLSPDTAAVSFVNLLTWWNTDYTKRISITLDNLDQAVTHTGVQVLVRLKSSRINYSDTLANGTDIRFTLDDHTTVLSYDIESWDASGESLVWVRIPSIAASAQQVIYMYYDNPSATSAENPTATWSGFAGVWNMDKTGANYIDGTGSGKTGTTQGVVTDVQGPTGNAIALNGSSNIDVGANLATFIGANSTVSFWERTNVVGNNSFWLAPSVTGVRDDSGFNEIYFGWVNGTGRIGINARNGASATSNFVVNDNNWRHVSMTRNSATGAVRFFINGVLNGSGTSGTGAVTTSFTKFGVRTSINPAGNTSYFNGSLDGIRIRNTIQTDAQIRVEYKYSVESNISYGIVENL